MARRRAPRIQKFESTVNFNLILENAYSVGLVVETLVVLFVDKFDPPFLSCLWPTVGVLRKYVLLYDEELDDNYDAFLIDCSLFYKVEGVETLAAEIWYVVDGEVIPKQSYCIFLCVSLPLTVTSPA